jgi:hypothetical protein
MMFIVRTAGERPDDSQVRIAAVRATPRMLPDSAGLTDLFVVGDDAAPERLRNQGWNVVLLRDGWYQDDGAGGIAIWGQGAYWEVRDTPFSVREAVGPAADATSPNEASGPAGPADIRRGIFGV